MADGGTDWSVRMGWVWQGCGLLLGESEKGLCMGGRRERGTGSSDRGVVAWKEATENIAVVMTGFSSQGDGMLKLFPKVVMDIDTTILSCLMYPLL